MRFFFIAAVPRSGTKWLSHLFTTDKTHCFHEAVANQCYANVEEHVERLLEFESISTGSFYGNQLYKFVQLYPTFGKVMTDKLVGDNLVAVGDSDCGLQNVLLPIVNLFSESRSTFIFRNGFDVALSLEGMMAIEGSASKKTIEVHREAGRRHGLEATTLFEVAVVRWVIGTKSLLHVAEQAPRSRQFKFEQVTTNVDVLKDLWNFLLAGEPPFDTVRAERRLARPANVGYHNKPAGQTIHERWQNLDAERRGSFLRLGAKLSEEIYEGWPDIEI